MRSPRAYEDLKQSGLLVLPSKRLLQYYKNSIRQTPCFNTDNLTWMQKEAMRQGISNFGMHGGIVIDEMSIQDDIVISRRSDSWDLVGIVDMDTTNNNILCIFFSPFTRPFPLSPFYHSILPVSDSPFILSITPFFIALFTYFYTHRFEKAAGI